MKGHTIVFDAITVKRESGFAFDAWHQNHYVPALLATGQLLSVQCYGSPLRAAYVNVIESDADAARLARAMPVPVQGSIIATERYTAEFIGEQIAPGAGNPFLDAAILYPVFFKVPAGRVAEFDAWYNEEHLGILLRCPYWPMCRRFRIHEPSENSWTHIALHYITDLRALESLERDEARTTPWRARLAQEPWFKGDYRVYYRYGTRHVP